MDSSKIAIGILLVTALWLLLRYAYLMRYRAFVCPKCRHRFKPTMANLASSMNTLGGRILVCPACGEKSLMAPQQEL